MRWLSWSAAVGMTSMISTTAALGACGFEGARGHELPFDAGPDAPAQDAAPVDVDAPVRASACAGGFKVIGGSSYLLLPQAVSLNWVDAFNRCPTITGAHLATFETPAEVTAVVAELPLTVATWTGVVQIANAPTPYQGWFNRIAGELTTIPIGFPWRAGEPNDFSPPENNEENGGELQPSGTFDDGSINRISRVLCECALTP